MQFSADSGEDSHARLMAKVREAWQAISEQTLFFELELVQLDTEQFKMLQAEPALAILQARAAWPASGLTLGLSFASGSGEPDGLKLDVCLCPDCRRVAGVSPGLDERLRAQIPGAAPVLDAGRLALLGTGIGGKGQRLNIYVEPAT